MLALSAVVIISHWGGGGGAGGGQPPSILLGLTTTSLTTTTSFTISINYMQEIHTHFSRKFSCWLSIVLFVFVSPHNVVIDWTLWTINQTHARHCTGFLFLLSSRSMWTIFNSFWENKQILFHLHIYHIFHTILYFHITFHASFPHHIT